MLISWLNVCFQWVIPKCTRWGGMSLQILLFCVLKVALAGLGFTSLPVDSIFCVILWRFIIEELLKSFPLCAYDVIVIAEIDQGTCMNSHILFSFEPSWDLSRRAKYKFIRGIFSSVASWWVNLSSNGWRLCYGNKFLFSEKMLGIMLFQLLELCVFWTWIHWMIISE